MSASASSAPAGERDENLELLAQMLLARHINVSVPDEGLRRGLLAADEPEIWSQCQRKFRCIAVVGAGASAPVLARGDGLASGLIEHFGIGTSAIEAEHERLRRITAVDPSEIEAQLAAIGQTVGDDRRVRAVISGIYRRRHPTILAYELLAHLLKHRFIDAIINMNFDELLDQSLDDELGVGEYERIVSDRDCVDIQSDVFASDYIPLHIKLHGTASEPESLRFTRESYYDSPTSVGTEAARLFRVPECVVLNVGFGMTSFDLHRLLAIPDTLTHFNLGFEPLSGAAVDAIQREREREGCEEALFPECGDGGEPPPGEEPAEASDRAMDALLRAIRDQVKDLSGGGREMVAMRPVKRHRAIVGLLGPASNPARRLLELPAPMAGAERRLDPIALSARPERARAGYLLRRTILELAFAMARGRGLVSISTLAVDRCGLYYDAYRRCAGADSYSWRELYAKVGFEQNPEVPDVLDASPELRREPGTPSREAGLRAKLLPQPGQGEKDDWHELPDLDLQALASRVLPQVFDSPGAAEEELLLGELKQLRKGTEYEIHSRDDRVCAKTFTDPETLKTLSALDANSYELVRIADDPEAWTEVDIISETGDWLLKRKKSFRRHLRGASQIRLVVAFLRDVDELRERFPGVLLGYQQPWHHNRHMAIVRVDGMPKRAVYFARHHRTPYVNPVLVRRPEDIAVLQTTFNDRWANATAIEEQPPDV